MHIKTAIRQFLQHLEASGCSRHTIRSYACNLRGLLAFGVNNGMAASQLIVRQGCQAKCGNVVGQCGYGGGRIGLVSGGFPWRCQHLRNITGNAVKQTLPNNAKGGLP